MRILIVGGAHQGKRAYAEAAYGLCERDFAPGERAVDALHRLVRAHMEDGGADDLQAELLARPDWVILCDEVGGGVIPVDALDRRWREACGRLCCALAEQADIVERVTCGIPLRLKGADLAPQPVEVALVRHGKTPGNLRGAFVGSIDQPLAPEGLAELRAFARQGRYPAVQWILSSPMRRCVETARAIYPDAPSRFAGETGANLILGLRERCFGEFEGRTHKEITAMPGYENWGRTEDSMPFPGGEPFEPFLRRIGDAFWAQVDGMVREGVRDLAIITHGGVIMGILSQFARPAKGYFDWMCPNGGGYRLACDALRRCIAVRGEL